MIVKLQNENFQSNYLKNLLGARGVNNIENFLNPAEDALEDWRNLDNIQVGVGLLNTQLNDGKSILVVVDCDVDGYTSGAIIYSYIKLIKPDSDVDYILHEHKQHGLQDCCQEILDRDKKYGLIILPDSSSNDYDFHELLASINTNCLVLDHHDVEKNTKISSNAIIINNQLSERYLNKDLTGAGVTWQFCRAYDELLNYNFSERFIDLASLGICADMGSVINLENRYIMKKGFNNIRNIFFNEAVKKQDYSMGGKVNPTTVAFYIVPMMNAMIRVGTMEEKKRLFEGLINGNKLVPCNKRGAAGTMEKVAIESLRECTNARSRQNKITDTMVEKMEIKIFKNDLLENKILFIRLDDEDDFPSEVVGLCCMKLAAKYKKPTLIGRLNTEGINRGSIRNVSDCELTDLKAFLNDSGLFEYVQGHPNSAGFSLPDYNLRKFHEYANSVLKDIDFSEGAYSVNFQRGAMAFDLKDLVLELGSMPEIWGQMCKEPLIYVTDINITKNDIQIMGKSNDTLKIEKNGIAYMKFKATDMIEELNRYDEVKINIVGTANINEWMGRMTPQIFIEDYEIFRNSITDF